MSAISEDNIKIAKKRVATMHPLQNMTLSQVWPILSIFDRTKEEENK
jgi:hypothetical protein